MERVVKIRQIFSLVLVLMPVPALADVGDVHKIKTSSAIVREAPANDSKQTESLPKGSEIMEMDIQGEWYEIYVADTDLGGWVHVSDLEILGGGVSTAVSSEAAVGESAEPTSYTTGAAQPASGKIILKSATSISAGVRKFETYLTKYNSRTKSLKGFFPFAAAEDTGNGELRVTVTNKWLEKPKARQKTSLIRLYSKWKHANKSPDVTVYAVDPNGNEFTHYPN